MTGPATFYSQEAANRRDSWLLVVAVAAVLGALGFAIGYGASGTVQTGIAVTIGAIVLAMVLSVGSYFGGDALVLGTSGAKEVDATTAPQLMNIVQEVAIAAGVSM